MSTHHPTLTPGSLIGAGSYEIHALMLTTDISRVYSGVRTADSMPVLIHRLKNDFAGYADAFLDKARTIMQVRPDGFARIIDAFPDPEGTFYITPMLTGQALDKLPPDIPDRRKYDITLQLAHAIESLHLAGISILGLTPNTVKIDTASGKPLIMAFSLPVVIFDDPSTLNPYFAPERLNDSDRENLRHDIYSLGAIAHLLALGTPPPVAQALALETLALPLSLPEPLARFIEKALEPHQTNRYPYIRDAIEELENHETHPDAEPVLTFYNSATPSETSGSEESSAHVPPEEPLPQPEPTVQAEPDAEKDEPAETDPTSSVYDTHRPRRTLIAVCALVAVGIAIGIGWVMWPTKTNSGTQTSQHTGPADSVSLSSGSAKPIDHEVKDSVITLPNAKFIYTGTVSHASSLPAGSGTATYAGSPFSTYRGEWKDGMWDGQGTLQYTNGDEYTGGFAKGKFTRGRFNVNPGKQKTYDYFEGEFRNGTPYNGSWYHSSGRVFQTVTNGKTTFIE